MHRPVILIALLIVAVLVFSASAQVPTGPSESRPTIDDLISLKRVGAPAVSRTESRSPTPFANQLGQTATKPRSGWRRSPLARYGS